LPWKNDVSVIAANSSGIPNIINIDEDLVTFLGWFIGEGHYNGKSCIRLNFNLNEKNIAEDLSRIVEDKFNVDTKIFETNGNGGRSLRLEFHSIIISQLLEKLCGRYSKNKHLPEWFTKIDKKLLALMLECHYFADGGVTISQRLARELFMARIILGQKPYFKNNYGQGYMVKECDSSVDSTAKEFENYFCYRIRGVEKEYIKEKVYNFSVEDIDTYIVNGVTVHNCKGMTVYVDGCRDGVLITEDGKNEKEGKKEGKKERSGDVVSAIERPAKIPCDIYQITADGGRWTVLVGLVNDRPYEIFCGKPKKVELGKTEKGYVEKEGRGVYSLHIGQDTILKDISDIFNDTQGALTRMISTSLRHGVDIQFIVQQLEKSDGTITSFTKAISRVLKKYIQDGTKENGNKCQECGGDLIRQEGCVLCQNCGWTKCN